MLGKAASFSRFSAMRNMVAQRSNRGFSTQAITYDHSAVEKKWQRHWDDAKTFQTRKREGKAKKYVLDMFPYPSGAGLHVGHPEGYTATDIMARYWRMCDFDVLHPMGWDAFGLPAEQHAINSGTHPRETTLKNIETFKRQLKSLGFSYDWYVALTLPNRSMLVNTVTVTVTVAALAGLESCRPRMITT